ncbi:MAG: DUF4388 domain-containing protein [Actinomycetota bacterium]|nr:DUF4388 domain-containing protein [Actinomycetota bacterium]
MQAKIDRLTSKIDLMLLGLVLERPMHGYEINQIATSEPMQNWLDISRTTVYYALTRLKKQGLITEMVEKQYNKPDLSIYRITEAGRKLFFDSLAKALAEQEKIFIDYNIGLFFINKLTKEKAFDVLEQRKDFLRKWRSSLQENLRQIRNNPEHPSTLKAVLDHTISIAESEISWISSFIENGSALKPSSDSVFALNGSLANTQLADILRIISSGKRTGTLSLKHGPDLVKICFDSGEVCYVTSSKGLSKDMETNQLGEEVIPASVLKAFNWPDGSFVFTPDLITDSGGISLRVNSCKLILEGCRMIDDWNRIKKVVPSSDIVYELVEGHDISFNKEVLTHEEKTVLDAINGIRSVERLTQITSLSIFDVSRILYTFVICGMVATVSKEKAELFDFLRTFSDALFERLLAIKAEKIARSIEEDLNNLAEQRGMPFSLQDFQLIDHSHVPQDFKEFLSMAKEFCGAQINAVQTQLGSRFAEHVLESIVSQITPEAHDIYERYGFDDIR